MTTAGNVALPDGVGTGIGSWPGTDLRSALAFIRETLPDLPHLVELPARGPGADLVGRGAALLVDLPVELQPHGWRLADAPGRDVRRGQSYLRSDLDDLAELFDGYAGPLKVQVTGPWTLCASLWLPRGERALTDAGARREVVASLAAGAAAHIAAVRSAVPGAQVVLQVDEPSLLAVLAGRLPTASGYGLVRAVEPPEVQQGLTEMLDAAHAAGASSAVHCCGEQVPVALLARAGAGAVSLDLSLLGAPGWEEIGEAVEAGLALWAGAVPSIPDPDNGLPGDRAVVDAVRSPWRRIGLPEEGLRRVVVTPTCGLAGVGPDQARAALLRVVSSARALAESTYDA
jgi:methionine synthase II (cobalamin-independent)